MATTNTSEWHGPRYWKNRSLEERLQNAKIPKKFEKVTLEDYDKNIGDHDVQYAIMTWLKSADENIKNGSGLYLFGGTGVGKTHLAQALLKQTIVNHKVSGMFIPATNYIEMMYDEISNEGNLPEEYSTPYLAKYLRGVYDLVVLDSLGDENDTEFTRRSISNLINHRHNAQLPIIITSLYNPKKLATRYGERLLSVITDSCRLLPIAGTDQRNARK